jgi:glutathione peroxidase
MLTLSRIRRRRRWAWLALPLAASLWTLGASSSQACPVTLNHTAARLQDGVAENLCQFAGRVVLVVNTASYCGYTPQYEGLEKLFSRYAGRGFTVLGFPSNDFKQEAADSKTIADLCFNTYGVKFPMFASTSVTGPAAHPLFAALAAATGQAPKWNFHKYLIDRDGKVAGAFPSQVAPLDRRLTDRIEQLLAQPAR